MRNLKKIYFEAKNGKREREIIMKVYRYERDRYGGSKSPRVKRTWRRDRDISSQKETFQGLRIAFNSLNKHTCTMSS
tara:strand:+ start:672 stop:902 length:231 start_codon:yes stop_codon:yes gene_type:complete